MAWTPFNFFKYDPETHDFSSTTFNIKQALNDNWDHIKDLIAELREKTLSVEDTPTKDSEAALSSGGAYTALAKKGNTQTTRVTNVSIPASSRVSDTTFTDYPYKAALSINGVTADMECKTFLPDHTDPDLQYLFAPWVNTGAGTLEVWANSQPTAAITIELITFEEVL